VLAGRKTVGAISGKVLYGGHHASKNFLRRYTGYVEQFGAPRALRRPARARPRAPARAGAPFAGRRSSRPRRPDARARKDAHGENIAVFEVHARARADALVENLTVFEMLLYTAEMKVDMRVPFRAKCRKVQAVVDQLALNTCRDTRIGSQVARGISGARPCRRPAAARPPCLSWQPTCSSRRLGAARARCSCRAVHESSRPAAARAQRGMGGQAEQRGAPARAGRATRRRRRCALPAGLPATPGLGAAARELPGCLPRRGWTARQARVRVGLTRAAPRQAASASARTLASRWWPTRACCSWTSRRPAWTRTPRTRCAARSGAVPAHLVSHRRQQQSSGLRTHPLQVALIQESYERRFSSCSGATRS
jgi:hypothetical protein